jgi:hypothetical protein
MDRAVKITFFKILAFLKEKFAQNEEKKADFLAHRPARIKKTLIPYDAQ